MAYTGNWSHAKPLGLALGTADLALLELHILIASNLQNVL